jgi:uncharacterized protein YeeX (DUF496 family)
MDDAMIKNQDLDKMVTWVQNICQTKGESFPFDSIEEFIESCKQDYPEYSDFINVCVSSPKDIIKYLFNSSANFMGSNQNSSLEKNDSVFTSMIDTIINAMKAAYDFIAKIIDRLINNTKRSTTLINGVITGVIGSYTMFALSLWANRAEKKIEENMKKNGGILNAETMVYPDPKDIVDGILIDESLFITEDAVLLAAGGLYILLFKACVSYLLIKELWKKAKFFAMFLTPINLILAFIVYCITIGAGSIATVGIDVPVIN